MGRECAMLQSMKFIVLIISILLIVVCYYGVTLYQKFQISLKLIEKAEPFRLDSTDHSVSLLVLGDSTAVGVGTDDPTLSVAGRLAPYINATLVENFSKSGAQTNDLKNQLSAATLPHYDYILIQIGANDIIRFKSASKTTAELAKTLASLPSTGNLIVLSGGNVGAAPFFPQFLRPFYTKLHLVYHKSFSEVVKEAGGVYVNLYTEPAKDPFVREPEKYLAPDGLHPSAEGYELWFSEVVEEIK